jgi:hypothetical protein
MTPEQLIDEPLPDFTIESSGSNKRELDDELIENGLQN